MITALNFILSSSMIIFVIIAYLVAMGKADAFIAKFL
jgi:hypothetical protein